MKLRIVLAVWFVVLSSLSWALDNTPENRIREANRYIAAVSAKELFRDTEQALYHETALEQRQFLDDLISNYLDIPAIENLVRETMVKHFTADELKALADLCSTPVGKSAIIKLGVCRYELGPGMQDEFMRAYARMQTKDDPNQPHK